MSPLLVVVAAVALAPLFSLLTRRVVPGVVFEIGLGILVGPAVLAWAHPTGLAAELADLGIAMLMFLAGMEVRLASLRGPVLRRAGGSWLASVALAGLVALVLVVTGHGAAALYVAIPLTTTALGTLLPILREKGVLGTSVGERTMALGTVGEFGPIVLIALLLSGRDPLAVLAFLAVFALVVVLGMWAARSWRLPRLRQAIAAGLHSTSQLPVRVAILAVVFFVLVADDLGIDGLLGAFCAGLVVRGSVEVERVPLDVRVFEGKIEAVGFGLLVPVFFVVSGMRIDLASMVAQPLSFLLVPATVLALLLCRGLPTLLVYRRAVGVAQARTLALLASTALPLVVVVTQLGTEAGVLEPQVAAGLVAGGLLSVLALPVLALRGPSTGSSSPRDRSVDADAAVPQGATDVHGSVSPGEAPDQT